MCPSGVSFSTNTWDGTTPHPRKKTREEDGLVREGKTITRFIRELMRRNELGISRRSKRHGIGCGVILFHSSHNVVGTVYMREKRHILRETTRRRCESIRTVSIDERGKHSLRCANFDGRRPHSWSVKRRRFLSNLRQTLRTSRTLVSVLLGMRMGRKPDETVHVL